MGLPTRSTRPAWHSPGQSHELKTPRPYYTQADLQAQAAWKRGARSTLGRGRFEGGAEDCVGRRDEGRAARPSVQGVGTERSSGIPGGADRLILRGGSPRSADVAPVVGVVGEHKKRGDGLHLGGLDGGAWPRRLELDPGRPDQPTHRHESNPIMIDWCHSSQATTAVSGCSAVLSTRAGSP